jgi:hypothetical protein
VVERSVKNAPYATFTNTDVSNRWCLGCHTPQVAYYAVSSYDFDKMHKAFDFFKEQFPHDEVRAALWNVTEAVRKPFLEMQREEFELMTSSDIVAGYGFSQAAIKSFLELQ